MFVTSREIDTTVPPVREEVHVDLQVIQVIVLFEDRMAGVGSPLCRRGIVIRLGAACHREASNRISRKGGRCALERSALTDERIEVTRRDFGIQRRKLGVAAVNADLAEVLIKESRVIAEPADEGVVFDVEITVKSNNEAMHVAVEKRLAES